MSISTAAKIGGAATAAAGVPATTYFAKDHIFLYEIERKIINGEVQLTESNASTTPSSSEIIVVKVASSDSKWSCSIKAKLIDDSGNEQTLSDSSDQTKIKTHIKKRIPMTGNTDASDSSITEEEKKANLKTLVWSCSKTRTKFDPSIESEWIISVKKSSNTLKVSLFEKEEQISENS